MKVVRKCSHCGQEEEFEVKIPSVADLIDQERGEEEPPNLDGKLRKYFVNCSNAICDWQSVVWAENPADALEKACIKHNQSRRDHDVSLKGIYGEEGVFRGCRGEVPKHL